MIQPDLHTCLLPTGTGGCRSTLNRRTFLCLTVYAMMARILGDRNVFAGTISMEEVSTVITGELKNWRSQAGLKGLEAAFQFLEKSDLKNLNLSKHSIDGENVFALVTKSMSRAPESAQFEAHRKYIDVHYLIAGQEIIGSAVASKLKVATAYDEGKDIEFYTPPATYTKLEMRPGRFAVFFPGQGHMPTCHLDGPHELHKVVIKVQVDYHKSRLG